MKRKTYLAWMPCEDKEKYGIYDGCIEPRAEGNKVPHYLKDLLEKASQKSGDEEWRIDAGTWYFGAAAVRKIKAEIEQK